MRLLLLAILLGGAIFQIASTSFPERISTHVPDLLPEEKDETVAIAKAIMQSRSARVLRIAIADANTPERAPVEAARMFAALLAEDPAFDDVLFEAGDPKDDPFSTLLHTNRIWFQLPFRLERAREEASAQGTNPADSEALALWLARETAMELRAFLAGPEAYLFHETIPADPLLLLPGLFRELEESPLFAGEEFEHLEGWEGERRFALLWTRIAASPFDAAGQEPVFSAIELALESVRKEFPGTRIEFTGINRFAAASEQKIRAELSLIPSLAFAGALLVALFGLRRFSHILHLFVPVLAALLWALVVSLFLFETLHVISLVISTILIGVAVDYGFHAFYHAVTEETASCSLPSRVNHGAQTLRRIRKPLVTSCVTTAAGFAFLLFSDLPSVRQIGVFVGSGLLFSLFFLWLYFPLLSSRNLCHPPLLMAKSGKRHGPQRLWKKAILLALVAGAGVLGLARVEWRDDIRDLQIPDPELVAIDRRIHALFSGPQEQQIFLTLSGNAEESLENLHAFNQHLEETAGRKADAFNLGKIIPPPSLADSTAAFFVEHKAEFTTALRSAMEEADFRPSLFEPFFEDFHAYVDEYSTVLHMEKAVALAEHLPGPLRDLWHLEGNPVWALTLLSGPPLHGEATLDGLRTIEQNEVETLNQVFETYRRQTFAFGLLGFAVMALLVLKAYGWRQGGKMIAIPAASATGAVALLGLTGQAIGLFHVIGLLLALCLSIDYAIFSFWKAPRSPAAQASVRLSALTSATSFGILTASSIPAVQGLGFTVLTAVLIAWLLCEQKAS